MASLLIANTSVSFGNHSCSDKCATFTLCSLFGSVKEGISGKWIFEMEDATDSWMLIG